MKEIIKEFILNEIGLEETRANEIYDDLERHPDILNELINWIKTREQPENAVCVEGYTAKRLMEETPLTTLDSHLYLIFLREDTEYALKDLEDGLPVL